MLSADAVVLDRPRVLVDCLRAADRRPVFRALPGARLAAARYKEPGIRGDRAGVRLSPSIRASDWGSIVH